MNKDLTAVIPLESNPEVFEKFAWNLGLGPNYTFIDIYSVDDVEMMQFIPRPVEAIILLFPIQNVRPHLNVERTFFSDEAPIGLKQNFQNACGLYALLHILINNQHLLHKDSLLATYLKEDPNFSDIDKFIVMFTKKYNKDFHESSGSSENPLPEDDTIDLHFISFISYKGKLWELDGRSNSPHSLYLGDNQRDDSMIDDQIDLLNQPAVLDRIKSYMNNVNDPNDKYKFSLLGLTKNVD